MEGEADCKIRCGEVAGSREDPESAEGVGRSAMKGGTFVAGGCPNLVEEMLVPGLWV